MKQLCKCMHVIALLAAASPARAETTPPSALTLAADALLTGIRSPDPGVRVMVTELVHLEDPGQLAPALPEVMSIVADRKAPFAQREAAARALGALPDDQQATAALRPLARVAADPAEDLDMRGVA